MLSTARLRGRKLFVWGEGAGGHRWQDWLSPGGTAGYAEIQAGLAQTQFQHLEMPAGAEWSWVEAYGNARVDPASRTRPTGAPPCGTATTRVDDLMSARELDAALEYARLLGGCAADPVAERRHRLGRAGVAAARATPDAMDRRDRYPVRRGHAHRRPAAVARPARRRPGDAFAGAATLCEAETGKRCSRLGTVTPAVLWHLAIMAHARADCAVARVRYLELLALAPEEPTLAAAAHRGLALIALAEGRVPDALERYSQACALDQANASLLVEAASTLLRHDAADEALRLIESAGPPSARAGRIRFLFAQALAQAGHRDRAADILEQGLEVPDLREGEDSLADLWTQVRPGVEIPRRYQFSMT